VQPHYPDVKMEIVIDYGLTDIVAAHYDAGVRLGEQVAKDMIAVRIGPDMRMAVVGAPSYFEKNGIPSGPADLKDHRIVVSTSAWASPEWRFKGDERVVVHAGLLSNTNDAAISAAKSGWGLTRVLHYQIGADLLDGNLQIALGDYEEPPLPIHVLHPEGRHAPAKVRAFLDLVVSRLRANRLLN